MQLYCHIGAIAQMGERLICIQEVGGSIPPGSTIICLSFYNHRLCFYVWHFGRIGMLSVWHSKEVDWPTGASAPPHRRRERKRTCREI